MNGTHLLVAALSCSIVAGVGGFLLLNARLKREARVARRLAGVRRETTRIDPRAPAGDHGGTARLVSGIGDRIASSGVLSDITLATIRATLAAGGMRADNALGLFIGSKVILVALLPSLALVLTRALGWLPHAGLLVVGIGAVVGLVLPDAAIQQIQNRRRARIDRGVADALDLLVICASSGMGLEPSLTRVVSEIGFAHPATAEEFAITANELRIFSNPDDAIGNLGRRTGLSSLTRLSTTLVQSMQYGTPIASALKTLTNDLRVETLTRFEERAARLPVLLTIPMVLCILPALFLVVGGPAAVQVIAIFKARP